LVDKIKDYILVSATAGLSLQLYMKGRKGNGQIIPAIKDHNATVFKDTPGKFSILNSYYASFFAAIVTSWK